MNRLAWACIIVASALLLFAMQPGPSQAATCGTASFYGKGHHGRTMANGRPFDMHALTAAMWGPKFGTRYRVTLGSKSVVVKITDRGPAKRLNRVIDLSYAAAKKLGMIERGVATVCLTRLS